MKIEALMTKSVATCRCDDSLEAAARLFWERDCGVVPIVDGEGVVVGMLTDRDVCIAAYTRGARLAELRVGDAMGKHVQACWPDDSTEVVLERMAEQKLRRLPVVDTERKLVGLVSLSDLVRDAARDRRPGVRERRLASIGVALAEITRPYCELAAQPERVAASAPRAPAPAIPVGALPANSLVAGAR